MIKTIKLNGGKELTLTANAATPFRYKQLFGGDLLQLFQEASKAGEDNLEVADTITKLAYIMSKQAEKADMSQISIDGFFSWLEDFEPMDFAYASGDIVGIYLDNAQPSVEAKKK